MLTVQGSFDDELRRRMALAAQQGWSQDEINRSANIERSLYQQRAASQQTQQPQPQKTSGRGGFLTSLISELGGAGGAGAGALAGTAIMPGVGTVIGGILGGLAGGFSGSAVEQKVRDNNVNWKKAGVEGLFSAVPAGTGKVVKTAKTVEGAAFRDQLASLFSKTPSKITNTVTNAGADAQAAVRGIVANAPVQGRAATRLTNREADTLNTFMNRLGITGSRDKQQKTLEQIQQAAGDEINRVVSSKPVQVAPQDILIAQQSIKNRILGSNGKGVAGFNAAQHGQIADGFAQQMSGITDGAGWLNFKRAMDDVINYSRSSQSPDPMVERIATKFRQEASDQLKRLYPGISVPNEIYSKSQQALNVMTRAANEKGIKVGTGFIDLGGTGVGINAKSATKDFMARKSQGIHGVRPMTDQFARQLFASGANNQLNGSPVQQQTADQFGAPQETPQQPLTFDQMATALYGGGADQPGQQQSQGNPYGLQYSSAELMAAAQQALAGGDAASYKLLASAASSTADLEKQYAASNTSGSGGLNSTAAGVVAQTETGLQALNDIKQKIAASSANNPGIGFIRGKNPFDTNAQSLQSSIAIAKQIVGKAMEGGVLRKEDEAKYAKILPTMNDTDAVALAKIDQLTNMISSQLQTYKSNIAGGNSFEDQMMQLLGANQGPQYAY